jgi:2-isopropylmalate synthase
MTKMWLLDTTLRDGEQTPGVRFTKEEKVEIARQLVALGVDVIQAGFPVASQGEFEAVREIARTVKGPVISALARTTKDDIETAYNALKESAQPRIDLVLATSPIHLKHKLRMTEDQVMELAVESVKHVKHLGAICQFYAEDATRSNWDFLVRVFRAIADVGCDVLSMPDTVGYTVPWEYQALFAYIDKNVPRPESCILGAHTHNDLGLATANTLAAIAGGARQVECTINGLGERAGNASLEEVVVALKTRGDWADLQNAYFSVNTREIYRTSQMVSQYAGVVIQPNKAVVGGNAFAHESGMHQDGLLKERSTYEILNPEELGIDSQSKLVLGKHSGRHAIKFHLKEMGIAVDDLQLIRIYQRFKELCDRIKNVSDMDLKRLAEEEISPAGNVAATNNKA